MRSKGIRMAEKVTCESCGEEFDKRGISMHERIKHGDEGEPQIIADGGSEASQAGAVTVQKDDLDIDEERIEEALPAANVTDDAITFRSIQEIEVTDEEMKRELLEELKNFISGGTLRV